jgi:hypothetical protein
VARRVVVVERYGPRVVVVERAPGKGMPATGGGTGSAVSPHYLEGSDDQLRPPGSDLTPAAPARSSSGDYAILPLLRRLRLTRRGIRTIGIAITGVTILRITMTAIRRLGFG